MIDDVWLPETNRHGKLYNIWAFLEHVKEECTIVAADYLCKTHEMIIKERMLKMVEMLLCGSIKSDAKTEWDQPRQTAVAHAFS